MLDAKAVETGMLLDKIEKLTVAQNLIMDSLKIRPGSDGLALVSYSYVSLHSHCSNVEHVELDCPVMAIQGPVPFRPNPMPYAGLSQAGRYHHPNEGYSNYNNPSYAQQRSGHHSSFHQPFGSAQQFMGNPRQTQFSSRFPQESLPSHTVPPDGYYVAYKPITLSCILFMFIEMKFIHCHSCVIFAMKSMSMCNDYVNYDEIII